MQGFDINAKETRHAVLVLFSFIYFLDRRIDQDDLNKIKAYDFPNNKKQS
jgi:hypothetical protein